MEIAVNALFTAKSTKYKSLLFYLENTFRFSIRGDVYGPPPTTGLCEVGVRRMKVLRESPMWVFELYLYRLQPALSWRS